MTLYQRIYASKGEKEAKKAEKLGKKKKKATRESVLELLSIETLEIEFKNGGVYQYFDVPERVYNGIISASSHGEYLAHNIKGHYRYSKV